MDMETNSIPKLLLKLSPPVMLALLIQSIYNIVDSFFVAQYASSGLTALSIIYPIQLLMTALATGTGAGVNILISRLDGLGETESQHDVIKSGLLLNFFHFILFAIMGNLFIKTYFEISTSNTLVSSQGILYARIVFTGSFGLFMESIGTKVLQARGNMVLPMLAQVTGSIINVVLDIALIFGIGSIITQSLYTLYIIGLNMILKGFTEDAVTVLGIYYKIQSFFFIPLLGFQQVLLPLISYNYGAGHTKRTQKTLRFATFLACGIMSVATLIFLLIPNQLIGIFSTDASLLRIGSYALRVISLSFVFAGLTIVITSYLQGIAHIKASIFIIVLRQVFLLVPLAWILHFFGLNAVWWTFPLTEIIASGCGLLYHFYFERFFSHT